MAEREIPLVTRRNVLGFGSALILAGLTGCSSSSVETQRSPEAIPTPYWPIRSVDTMKQSRDEALVILKALNKNQTSAQSMLHTIDQEIQNIANLHTTHVAIGTPYDEPFLPVAKAYIASARSHGLSIFWRGNFNAYDLQDANNPSLGGWFNTPHNPHFMEQPGKIAQFIDQHGDLFKQGDIFMPWPEPENVVKFYTNKIAYQNLLLAEYEACKPLRKKGVLAGNCSMNGDVAKDLDPALVKALGDIVFIDHNNLQNPQEMGQEIRDLHRIYPHAQVLLGEFSVSDPPMTDQEQAKFTTDLFNQMKLAGVLGMNYWVDIGGQTQLEDTLTKFRPAYYVVQRNYAASEKAKR